MKKIITFLLIISCLFALYSCGKSDEDYSEYCYHINSIIKDIDFETGKVDDGKIVLFVEGEEVYNKEFEKYDSSYKIKSIRKDENKIFFIINVAVDDEDGIVFVNHGTDDLMDGLWSIERIGGNSYKYKTYK